jgi:undecaprenyl-diphosphatase
MNNGQTELTQTQRPYKKYLPVILVAFVLYTLFAGLTLFVAGGATGEADFAIEQTVYGWRSPGLNTLIETITYCGNTASIITLILLLLALPKTRVPYGLPVFAAGVLTTVIKVIVKTAVARPRPDAVYFLVQETGYSYPSGHSITSVAVYGILAWLLWYYHKPAVQAALHLPGAAANAGGAAGMSGRDRALMILCAFLAFAIGLSRIYVGVHHPTDILGGWLAGIATALLILAAVVHMVNTGVTAKLIADKARVQSESAAQAATDADAAKAAPAETEDAE